MTPLLNCRETMTRNKCICHVRCECLFPLLSLLSNRQTRSRDTSCSSTGRNQTAQIDDAWTTRSDYRTSVRQRGMWCGCVPLLALYYGSSSSRSSCTLLLVVEVAVAGSSSSSSSSSVVVLLLTTGCTICQ